MNTILHITGPTTLIQEFGDYSFGFDSEDHVFYIHKNWLSDPEDLPGRYVFISKMPESDMAKLKSMQSGITQFTHEGKLWTYVGTVRIVESGTVEEIEPHFEFSTNPYESEYFPARYVLDYMEFEEAYREGMI